MPIRLKVERRKGQQISKVKDLMQMFKVPYSNSYYIIGGSSLLSNLANIDPKIAKTKDLFEMIHLTR
jgi:hypothetical protein